MPEEILYQILRELATNTQISKANTEAAQKTETHLKELNGKVAKHEQDMITLMKDNQYLYEKFGEIAVYRTDLEKQTKQRLETEAVSYKKYFLTAIKYIAIVLGVLFFNLLLNTGIISKLEKLPF